MKHSIFWFRRDLRLEDNTALFEALSQKNNILPIFIFDDNILNELPADDPRVHFIYKTLRAINQKLRKKGSSLLLLKGDPVRAWKDLIHTYSIDCVFFNKDYEPYAVNRDRELSRILSEQGIELLSFKDQVIHEESDIMKTDQTPYHVFTPYKNKWLKLYKPQKVKSEMNFENFHKENFAFPEMEKLGLKSSNITVRDYNLMNIGQYEENRNYPGIDSGTHLGPHLRFGTVSIRQLISQLNMNRDHVFLSELIWREFFMQILFHFPQLVTHNFRSKYDGIKWLNREEDFEKWTSGNTGYPMVDAGMRQLNKTGYMHNRVRMVCAGFLCKHLLIDWRLGESYFAKKLLDYELSSNNGNWQWAAGTGCDAAPYFRVFNPMEQLKKFDKNKSYIRKWIPELDYREYPSPIVEHKFARNRALETYKNGIKN